MLVSLDGSMVGRKYMCTSHGGDEKEAHQLTAVDALVVIMRNMLSEPLVKIRSGAIRLVGYIQHPSATRLRMSTDITEQLPDQGGIRCGLLRQLDV